MTGLVELTCTTCKQTKPVDEFPVRSNVPNGRRGQCRDCHRKVRRQNYRPTPPRSRTIVTGLVELTCTTCKQTKPIAEFPSRSSSTTGRRGQCRDCFQRLRRHNRPTAPHSRTKPVHVGPALLALLRDITISEGWEDKARCKGQTAQFYPSRNGNFATPKQLCQQCPVQFQCLEWAIRTNETEGVWGGFSARERRAIRRRHLQVAS